VSDVKSVNRNFLKANEIIEAHHNNSDELISILQEVQEEYRYLPEEILNYIAMAVNITPSKVFGVATFYENFSLAPKGKYIIRICDGTACHVRKSTDLIVALRKKLGLTESKDTTDDLLFTLQTVSCIGACGLAPAIMINEEVYGKVTPEKAEMILDEIIKRERINDEQ